MRLLPFILAVLTVLPQSTAVGASASEEAHDLVVSSFYWGRIDKTIIDPSAPMPGLPRTRPRRDRRRFGPPPTIILQRETYVLVRNTGERTVKSVAWAYVFYIDEKRENELRRYQFQTKQKLQPGEMKFLTERVAEDAPTSYGTVVIERIEFEDGTTWQRAPATG
jgi:hypothetical protein